MNSICRNCKKQAELSLGVMGTNLKKHKVNANELVDEANQTFWASFHDEPGYFIIARPRGGECLNDLPFVAVKATPEEMQSEIHQIKPKNYSAFQFNSLKKMGAPGDVIDHVMMLDPESPESLMLSQWCFVARRQRGVRLKLVSTLSAFIDLSHAGNHLPQIILDESFRHQDDNFLTQFATFLDDSIKANEVKLRTEAVRKKFEDIEYLSASTGKFRTALWVADFLNQNCFNLFGVNPPPHQSHSKLIYRQFATWIRARLEIR